MITDAKKKYYRCQFYSNASTSRGTWKIINEIVHSNGNCKATLESLALDGNKVTDTVSISNYFNNYFSTIGRGLANALPECNMPPLQ